MDTDATCGSDADELDRWRELGQQLRVDSIRMAAAAGSGHPTSAMSAADLISVLLAKYLRYDFDEPRNPRNDHLIFSKGHASPLLYAAYKAASAITDEEMLTFRRFGSRLEGHPVPSLPWVEVATGSLGQGLPIGVGIAIADKRLARLPTRTWVLCGDGELAEGSMWEAFEQAGFSRLDNLIAVLDINRLGQTGETRHGWDLAAYTRRMRAFGWRAIEVDGHDVAAIDRAYAAAVSRRGRPTAIVARTEKGHGVAAVANKNGFHGKPLHDPEAAIRELGGRRGMRVAVARPAGRGETPALACNEPTLPSYPVGSRVATRKAFGEALAALGDARGDVVVLDGEVSNSTFTEIFARAHPERYFEMFIAEQQMVAAAVGMQARGWVPFASTFAAFLTRAFDFVRMAAMGDAKLCLVGSHAGVSIGEDGPSQMGLEDLAMFRAVHGSTVLYPADANQTARLVAAMAVESGIVYLRTTRASTPVLYAPDEHFEIGGSRVVLSSDEDQVTLVAAGITLHEALRAAELLAGHSIAARVVDCYSLQPIDARTLREAAAATGLLVTIEDHGPAGGLGDAVLDVFADGELRPRIVKLAVRSMPGSGRPRELLSAACIDAEHIARVAAAAVMEARDREAAA